MNKYYQGGFIMSQNLSSTKRLTLSAIFIALNLVLGYVVGMLNIPLIFMDTLGTIFGGAILGPVYGMIIGGLTNVILGILTNPKDIPFALVNIAVGLIVGLIAKKFKFSLPVAIGTGLLLAIIAPMIGTPIAIYLYDGITGDFNDVFFTAMKNAGSTIFSAAFIPRVTSNIIDKVVCCVIVALTLPSIKKAL